MFQILFLLLFLANFSKEDYIDFRVITAVRNSLQRSLNYINDKLDLVNVDCLLGVSFAAVLLKDAYLDERSAHIMDRSTTLMYNQAKNIIYKAAPKYEKNTFYENGENWKFHHLLKPEIWFRKMTYRPDLPPSFTFINTFLKTNTVALPFSPESYKELPNTDTCIQSIVNVSSPEKPSLCSIDKDCYGAYFENVTFSKGYELTHRLLLLQFARQRNCMFKIGWYRKQSKQICSTILSEIFTAERYQDLDRVFDLFMEQVFLCGYEGYSQFFKTQWLHYIIKSQRAQGCFADDLTDNLKTRIKKNMNYFQNGCNDHSTGLGAAVLALYYNFLVKEDERLIDMVK